MVEIGLKKRDRPKQELFLHFNVAEKRMPAEPYK